MTAVQAAESLGDVTVETFSSRDMHVRVEKPAQGYLCTLSMSARVPLPPDLLYELLVDPAECKRIFTTLKQVCHRRVLSDDGQGNRTVEVDQTGAWRFLMFRGTFTVRMIVEQRKQDRSITFRLARAGFMKDFSGTWEIRPFDNSALDQLVNRHNPTPMHRLQSGLSSLGHSLGFSGQQQDSLVQLQQSIAPSVAPPPAVTKLLQRIAARQITNIMTDLQAEARRINSGQSSKQAGSNTTEDSSDSSSKTVALADAASNKGRKFLLWRNDSSHDKKQLTTHVADLR